MLERSIGDLVKQGYSFGTVGTGLKLTQVPTNRLSQLTDNSLIDQEIMRRMTKTLRQI